MAMPPRGPAARPAAVARPVSGRTPIAATTTSAGSRSPVERVTSSSPIAVTAAPRWSEALARRMRRWTGSTISGSSGAITWSVASTMAVATPRWTRFSAISRPMNPPPITTAVFASRTASTMASVSSTLRNESARSMPGIGGRTGEAPGERISAS